MRKTYGGLTGVRPYEPGDSHRGRALSHGAHGSARPDRGHQVPHGAAGAFATGSGKILGTSTRVSEAFDRKRGLSINMIRTLHEKLGIFAEILIGAIRGLKTARVSRLTDALTVSL